MILQQLTNHILVFTQNAYINQVMLYSYQYTNRMSWKICIIAVKLYLVKQIYNFTLLESTSNEHGKK